MARELIEVEHPGIEGTALVPESALRHMSPQWHKVADDAETGAGDTPPTTAGSPPAAKKAAGKKSAAKKPGTRAATPKEQ